MKGWKTLLFNGALLGVSLTDYLTGGELIRAILTDPTDAGVAIAVVTAVNLVLRKLTTTPLGSKQ
jgi:hypothetical protein